MPWWAAGIDDAARIFTKGGRQALKGRQGFAYGAYHGLTGEMTGLAAAGGFLGAGRRAGYAASSMAHFTGRGITEGWKGAWGGWGWLNLPMAAFAAGQAETGHKLSAFASSALPSIGYLVGSAIAGPLGGFAAGFVLDPLISKTVGRGMQFAHDINRNTHRLNTGGDYVDTQRAFTMRQAAANEMSRSLLNARSYLGKEAAFFHA